MKCTKTMGRTRVCICVYTVWSNMGQDKGVERVGRRGVMYVRTYIRTVLTSYAGALRRTRTGARARASTTPWAATRTP